MLLDTPTPLLPERVRVIVGSSFDYPVNCFSVSQFFFQDTKLQMVMADEMLDFTAQNFRQIDISGPWALTLIWSRSSLQLPIGEIKTSEIAKRKNGFPFGLILEHSFVQINDALAFQKADPTRTSQIEVVPIAKAVEPYLHLNGFEITYHVSRSQA